MIHNTNYMDIEHGDEESQPESWYTKTKSDDIQGLIIDENTGANIAVSYDPQHAALIAAAPELLAAAKAGLESAINLLEITEGEGYPGLEDAISTIRAAIRKAEGK